MPRKFLTSKAFDAAGLAGDWFLENQLVRSDDANRGRYLYTYYVKFIDGPSSVGYVEGSRERCRKFYSTVWNIATISMALAMLYTRNGNSRLKASVAKAMDYLETLQILDPDHPHRGAFHETTPQTGASNVRDAVTAGWGFVKLSKFLERPQLLDRAVLFAEWLKKHAFRNGFPASGVVLNPDRNLMQGDVNAFKDDELVNWTGFSAHGGSANFFLDLFEATGERKWLDEIALPVLDTFIRRFMLTDGSLVVHVDLSDTGHDLDNVVGMAGHEDHRHRYNDDFASLALMKAYRLTGNDKYLAAARKYLDWAADIQNQDGSFGDPVIKSASATLALEMLEMDKLLEQPVYEQNIEKAIAHLLTLQMKNPADPEQNGGFWGLSPWVKLPFSSLMGRITGYAIAALLKYEGERDYDFYSC